MKKHSYCKSLRTSLNQLVVGFVCTSLALVAASLPAGASSLRVFCSDWKDQCDSHFSCPAPGPPYGNESYAVTPRVHLVETGNFEDGAYVWVESVNLDPPVWVKVHQYGVSTDKNLLFKSSRSVLPPWSAPGIEQCGFFSGSYNCHEACPDDGDGCDFIPEPDCGFCGCEIEDGTFTMAPNSKSSVKFCNFPTCGTGTCNPDESRPCDNEVPGEVNPPWRCVYLLPPMDQGGAHWDITEVTFRDPSDPNQSECWLKLPVPIAVPLADVEVSIDNERCEGGDPNRCYRNDPGHHCQDEPSISEWPPLCGLTTVGSGN